MESLGYGELCILIWNGSTRPGHADIRASSFRGPATARSTMLAWTSVLAILSSLSRCTIPGAHGRERQFTK
jgi:hypothetical protein